MKKLIATLTAVALCAVLLAACGGSSSSEQTSSAASSDTTSSEAVSEPADSAEDGDASDTAEDGDAAGDTADTAKLEAIVAAIEAVNEVPNTRELGDFDLENDLELNMDNIVAAKGDVTNDQADCALVLAIQAKDGAADAVKSDLEAYKERISSSLYAEFADKVAQAQDSRIVVSGNYVVMVIAGVNGPDYAEVDAVIQQALA